MLNSIELQKFISREGGFEKNQIQQVSLDLTIASIAEVGDNGSIYVNKKAELPHYCDLKVSMGLVGDKPEKGFYLQPGFYALEFNESVEVPLDKAVQVIHRSSLLRSGVEIKSAIYDPGFNGQLGAFAVVHKPIFIELGARIACVYGFTCTEVSDELKYQGNYQKL